MKWAHFQALCQRPMAPEWEQYFFSDLGQINEHLSREITGFLFPSSQDDEDPTSVDPAILIEDMCKVLPPQVIIVGDEDGEKLVKGLNRFYQYNGWYEHNIMLVTLVTPLTDNSTRK